jgi:hypothetical protein
MVQIDTVNFFVLCLPHVILRRRDIKANILRLVMIRNFRGKKKRVSPFK